MNPKATIVMKNKTRIVLELLPETAPNTVNSFIYAAQQGFFDNHAIERIVPGSWIDMSYRAFGKTEAKYLIPNEYQLHPELKPQIPVPGTVAMGGYETGIAGCEFFFPMRECPELQGKYPVFAVVTEGFEELKRIEQVKTVPVTNYPEQGVEINVPIEPEIIDHVELDLYGSIYEMPLRIENPTLPACWSMP